MNTKLILVVLHGTNCDPLMTRLLDVGYRVTTFSSVGAFFRRKQVTLLIGIPEDETEKALDIIRATNPTPPDSDEHYATIFVLAAGQCVPL